MSNGEGLVPKILEKIHGELQNLRKDTNNRFGDLHQELGELGQDTTRRLDLLTEAATRTNTELARVNERLGSLEKTVERNGERFEHALLTQGATRRELEARVARLEAHVGIEL